jgi:hypothetical protein
VPQKRKRFTSTGDPADCMVVVLPGLAAYLYRAMLSGDYRDETELVNAIVRAWTKEEESREPLDWKKVLAELKKIDGRGKK